MPKYLLLLLFLPVSVFAQNSITGRVLNTADKKPVVLASVFLSSSSVGNTTQNDGSFKLTNVKNGEYDLVVSCVGYETFHRHVSVYNSDLHLPDMELNAVTNTLGEVKIVGTGKKAKEDPNRKHYIKLFTDAFFGATKNAKECKLINPEQLNFKYDRNSDQLTATARHFLILENKALGYRIQYLLESFMLDPGTHILAYTGSSVFQPLDTTAAQQEIWKQKRIKAYRGSEMQFLRSCISNDLANNGFTVHRLVRTPTEDRPPDSVIYANIKFYSQSAGTNGQLGYWLKEDKIPRFDQKEYDKNLNHDEFIKTTSASGVFSFNYTDCLMINYINKGSTSFHDNSIITFNGSGAYFDSNGIIINPESNKVEGYWGTLRMADTLPVDYMVPKN